MQLIAPNTDTRIALEWKYQAKPLLSSTEAHFHTVLASLSDGRCHILCKPRLADFLDHGHDKVAFNKISQKHVDFLVCRTGDWMPMLAIELDDASHEKKAAKERDMLVNAIFAQVGIPLVRIHCSEVQQVDQLVQKLSHAWQHRWQLLEKNPMP
ncbi:Protein of unknown function [Prosthecobacter debontii]|uniref:DUF2726 domain-containing protein n=1 Tax=Prosthecobacter debontii TaxID=48467 RepID=A0A1T4WES6_9BACT|nr:DUF2726 domain-containing protein [Prosthecobacter debontii]SKA75707.1 Protein of unknown function [Prosthecobacter debontii]